MPSTKFRTDIQALRGFSIAAVLAYHAAPGLAPGGFLGVDVFFVISGYLMAAIIAGGIDAGRFSLVAFYLRRARRLLPAAYVTFAVCAAIAPALLASLEYEDFRRQLIGALTFTSNIVLWRQSGYFAQAAELKPLLHTWSLSVEEQFYFFLPAFLMLCPRRFWLLALALAAAVSFIACGYVGATSPSAAFYLLPTRAWEMLLGSIGALLTDIRMRALASRLFWPAVVALPAVVLFPFASSRPGYDALIACVATLLLILARDDRASRGPLVAALARLGDLSYPLYLVHWPIFAFMRNIWLPGPPLYVLGLAGLGSVPIAWALARFVERPARDWLEGARPLRQMAAFALPACVIAGVSLASNLDRSADYIARRGANRGLADVCDMARFAPEPACRRGVDPRVLLWGDSFAMHFAQALAADERGFVQATMSACGPLLDFAIVDLASNHPHRWSENCIAFNRAALDYLRRTPSLDIVALSGAFLYALEDRGRNRILADGEARPPSVETAADHLVRTIVEIRKLDRRVAIVAPVPGADFDVSLCAERSDRGQPVRGVDRNCAIDRRVALERQARVREVLHRAAAKTGAPLLDLGVQLCTMDVCETQIDGVVLYRDSAHLSADGSALLGRKFGVSDLIVDVAR